MRSSSIILYALVAALVLASTVAIYTLDFPFTITKEAGDTRVYVDMQDHENTRETERNHGGHDGEADDHKAEAEELEPTVEFQLVTALTEEGFSYIGKDGEIENVKNPTLKVKVGDVVKITVIKGDADGIEHDLYIDGIGAPAHPHIKEKGETAEIIFRADKPGKYPYYCTVPGHREAGMEGLIIVEG